MDINKPTFEVLDSASKLHINKTDYFVSKQRIVQFNGSSSEHLVIKKQPLNIDGSPQGTAKQLFIPFDDSKFLFNHVSSFLTKE